VLRLQLLLFQFSDPSHHALVAGQQAFVFVQVFRVLSLRRLFSSTNAFTVF
jgi:hypothetical protein